MENGSDKQANRILIAEDEESNFELLKGMLSKREIEVFWAKNGKQAVEYCQEKEFALILMDIKMPEMNGYEAINKLREMGVNTPVIAQTAYARLEDEKISKSEMNQIQSLILKFLAIEDMTLVQEIQFFLQNNNIRV